MKNSMKIRYASIAIIIGIVILKIIGANNIQVNGAVVSSGEAQIGGDFTLVDQDGKEAKDSNFRGKNMLVYFGFSHCPDVCPTDLALISSVIENLGDNASDLQPIFITVDPERDNPAQIKTYLSNFNPKIIGLTGSAEQITEVANKYHIFYQKVKSEDLSGYLMDHSAFIYLMGKDGKYITHFNNKQSADEIAAEIRKRLN